MTKKKKNNQHTKRLNLCVKMKQSTATAIKRNAILLFAIGNKRNQLLVLRGISKA